MRNLLVATIAAAILTPLPAGTLSVGDKVPASKLNEIVWNWDGSDSINDYLGEPVLVDFWGKNCGPCIGSAVPHAIKMLDKFGDQGLHVLLVEVQGHTRDIVVPFMAQYWSGRVPMGVLGANAPFQLPGDSIPKAGLVGVDGTLVWTGNGGEGCEKVLAEQLNQLHQVKSLDPSLKGLTKDLNARNFGKALTAAKVASEKGKEKAKADATVLIEHLNKTIETRLAAANRLATSGRVVKAKTSLQALAKQVNGDKDWTEKVTTQLKALDDAANKDEFLADKMLTEAETMGTERSGREGAAGKIGEMLKKYPNARSSKYAAELKTAFESKEALR